MYRAALYVRLSREDRNKISKNDDSESIVNQINMLSEYCQKQGWDIFDIYNDEDYSGSDRGRPEFNRMLNDAKDGMFDIVLCKTQSRFARDVELVEKYINTKFPIWGVRFISVVDNGDSHNIGNRKSRQINSLVDQWYLEDLSQNIKSTLSSKRRQGQWVGAFAPFGYIKDPDNKNHLIVDDEAADVVRCIYKLYHQGIGINSIAQRLNIERIPNPATYKKRHGQSFQCVHGDCSDTWIPSTISGILTNPVYIGHTVQGKVENINYKSKKKRQKPKSQWDVVENTHEPIIDLKLWSEVQALKASKPRSNKTGEIGVFANKLRCKNCGGSMRSWINKHQKYYRCSTNQFAGNHCPQGAYISHSVLERIVLERIQASFKKFVNEKEASKNIKISGGLQSTRKHLCDCLEKTQRELTTYESKFKQLYIDKLDGVITAEDFKLFFSEFNKDKEKLENLISSYKKDICEIDKNLGDETRVDALIWGLKNINKLDRATVDALIDYIEIGGTKQNRIIVIHWNF